MVIDFKIMLIRFENNINIYWYFIGIFNENIVVISCKLKLLFYFFNLSIQKYWKCI